MELIDYLNILQRRKWVVISTVFFALLVVLISVVTTPPKFTSVTTVRILTSKAGGTDYIEYDIPYTERLMGTYIEIASSAPAMEELAASVYRLPKISVRMIPNTELLEISAEDEDPGLVQYSANKLAEILIRQSREVEIGRANPVNIYVVEPAEIPSTPSSPSPYLIVGLGLVVGIIGGLGLAFLFDNLDTRLYNKKQIESITGLKVIGDIPEDLNRKDDISPLYEKAGIHAEAYRRLRTNIFSPQKQNKIKSLLVTSSVVKDGRSEIAANLALSLSLNNRFVLLIDADLRSPSQHRIFGLDNEFGLSYIDSDPDKVRIQKTKYKNLEVITSGNLPVNPVDLLDGHKMFEFVKSLEQKYDVVIFDAPSCITVTDPAVLAGIVDSVLLVVRHGWVRREALQTTIQYLNNVKANFVGVVANRTQLGVNSRFFSHENTKSRLDLPISNNE
jgi:capsular exopolysaccharide synthesis family protein